MRSEASIAHGAGVVAVASPVASVLELRLNDALSKRSKGDVLGLVSFGTAGALWRYYRPGQWLVAAKICDEHGTVLVPDPNWTMALISAIPGAQPATFIGVNDAVRTPGAKRALHEATGANAADMESHVVARVALAHGLPFAVARVVLDPFDTRVPDAAMAGLLEDGSTHVMPVLRALMKAPRDILPLAKLAWNARTAHRSLKVGRKAIGVRMSFPE
jgi:uridine phosphorylase